MSNRSEKLQDAIGMVSDDYIAEAHDGTKTPETGVRLSAKRTSLKRRVLAIAACLVVVAGVGALAFMGLQPNEIASVDDPVAKPESIDVDGDDGYMADETPTTSLKMMSTADSDGAVAGAVEAMGAAETASALTAGSITVGNGNLNGAEAGLLTAAEWNDNENWPFFTNLVNAETISFPSFGIDPRNRVRVAVVDASGAALIGERVVLRDASGTTLWNATSGKDGIAYLFFQDGEEPALVAAPESGVEQSIALAEIGQQGSPAVRRAEDVTLNVARSKSTGREAKQVMFIVDTTGSMSDEIAYLQADFAAIASEVGTEGVTYSANFYRDEGEREEYVTKCNPFTDNVSTVQSQLNDEYADGGGDEPEAVAQILQETITDNASWRDDAAKIAFLVFDAPPHTATDSTLVAAVRSAAERGIRIVPVVASNASRDTELFGRALAICTGATYVFLTDDSGIGDSHLEPIVGDYTVESLHDIIVRLIREAC